MHPQRPFDPVVTFRNSQGEAARGTLTSLQRRSLVLEIYNPYSIVQVSEVLSDLVIRSGERAIYQGKAVVVSLLNTGLMAVVSLALIDEWSDLNLTRGNVREVGLEATRFVEDWQQRFRVKESYQVAVSEFRAFLAETARWIDQADMLDSLPKDRDGRLADAVFWAMAEPLMIKGKSFLVRLEGEAASVPPEDALLHRSYAQAALHPLVLRAPFVYRTFAKPLGYAGDYEMVNQLLGDPRQGSSTYIQLVNATFLRAAVAQAHRNRIDILVKFLQRAVALGEKEGRQIRILNIGCGPAVEVQRLIASGADLRRLSFTLLDFSGETLDYTRGRIADSLAQHGRQLDVNYVQESVHDLLKRPSRAPSPVGAEGYDFVYCAGLFDYLSDKVCTRLIRYFMSRANTGARMLLTNVHSSNPERHGMEHLLEWHLIYRDEAQMAAVMSEVGAAVEMYTDATGVNLFAETTLPARAAAGAMAE
ncbi:class I SAM-dependent methyltransferase [Hydrogenophaga sp. RWCD_12]|uniref:class I SAM-dependent methyltransferase n=1 Tax=Hydrogenophaga sp. RWCD_12 TaxID=3391190 RepID=UPI003984B51A